MPTTLVPAPATTVIPPRRLVLTNPADVQHAADALAGEGVADLPDLFDWMQLPPGLTQRSVLRVVDAFCAAGPFGFRGPASALVPPDLTLVEGDVVITDVLVAGSDGPSDDQAASPTILSFHRPLIVPEDRRPHLTLERSGSLDVETVRATLEELGFGLVIGSAGENQLLDDDVAA